MTGPWGEIERHSGHTSLRFTRDLNHEPTKVWRALTESEHMRWWMPVDMIGPRKAGAHVRLEFWPDLVESKGLDPDAGTGRIEIWEPPHVFEWSWGDTRVHFEITPTGSGCSLHLLVRLSTDDPGEIVDNAGGFHLWMEHLVALLETGSSAPIAQADAGPLEARYRSQLAD